MSETPSFVSRAGLKLYHALTAFSFDPAGLVCADFGCNVGGFTDCLLQHGAAHVIAIDTGYNVLDYKLRSDPHLRTTPTGGSISSQWTWRGRRSGMRCRQPSDG